MPCKRCSNSSTREPAKIRCVWLSTKPGSTTCPAASRIVVSGSSGGNSAVGRYKEALKYAKLALAQAPDDGNRGSLKTGIEKLEQSKDMNQ